MIDFTDDDMPDIAAGFPIDDGVPMNNTKAKQEAERVTKHTEVNIPPEELVTSIIARPGSYDACLLGLAQAYESQRERIADLEDDVERLRPVNPFVPEVLYRDEDSDTDIETSPTGGIDIVQRDHNCDSVETSLTSLTKAEGRQLATALAKWAGLSVVEWIPVGHCCGPAGMQALLTDGGRVNIGTIEFAGHYKWGYGALPTHYIPLPKPPEAT